MIFSVFTSADYVKKLVSFLSLEENKGKDQYSDGRFVMFKVNLELWPSMHLKDSIVLLFYRYILIIFVLWSLIFTHYDSQNLFRNFGSCVFENLKPHLERLAVDSQVSRYLC